MAKIFIIAGEASGDWLGSKLIHSIRQKLPGAEISGVGGPKMELEGFTSIFPMKEISLMGFAEILPHAFNLMKRLKQTEQAIIEQKPDVVVSIDSPGFNFRIAERIRHLRPQTKLIHYVAPTVWAYKPERAEKVNKLFDKLLCILPFEPEYFTNAEFIGHPVIEDGLDKGDGAGFKERHKLGDFICLMPGSRKGEVKRLLPIFLDAAKKLGKEPVIIAADNVQIDADVKIVHNREKLDCFAASSYGIIKSGTSGLEYAFAGRPYVIAYKANPITIWLIRRMVKIQFANLVNILFGREVVPELLQEKCTAAEIAQALGKGEAVDKEALLKMLTKDGTRPSDLAADIVISSARS